MVKGQEIQKKETICFTFLLALGDISSRPIREGCKECDFVSSFYGPCLLVPLLCTAFFLKWKDGLPLSLSWSREAGRTAGED